MDWHSMGVIYADLGRDDDAIAAFRRAAKLETNTEKASNSYFNLAVVYNRQGKTDAERQAYEQAVNLNPNAPEALRNLGIAWTKLGKTSTGIPFMVRATKLSPNDPKAWMVLAVAYNLSGNLPERDKAWQRLQEINPQMGSQLNTLFSSKQK